MRFKPNRIWMTDSRIMCELIVLLNFIGSKICSMKYAPNYNYNREPKDRRYRKKKI
jgi:hypothetical protein